jgi:dihydrofolate reductase
VNAAPASGPESSGIRVSAIVAAAENDVIGASGRLPWYLPEDLRHFARLTRGHVLVSGRRTHASVIERLGHPLDDRITVVATHASAPPTSELEFDTVIYRSSARAALSTARALERFAGGCEVFVIGGAQMYAQMADDLDRVYLTRVHVEVDGDVRLPSGWLDAFTLTEREATVGGRAGGRTGERTGGGAGDGLEFSFERYDRRAPR